MGVLGFFKKRNHIPKQTAKRIVYNRFCAVGSGENGSGALVATASKNCDFAKRNLRGCVGLIRYKLKNKALDIPLFPVEYGDAKDLFVFEFNDSGERKDCVGVVMGNNRFYIYDEMNGTPGLKLMATGINFKRAVRVFSKSGDEKLLLCYNDSIYTYDPIKATKSLWMEQKVTDACFFNERLFICYGNTLKYSAPTDYKNFNDSIDEGGEIKIVSDRGDIFQMVAIGETAYVFLERGVYKLSLGGAGRDFIVEDMLYKGGPIVANSVCVCLNKIAFLAEDGIFVLDGVRLERYAEGLNIKILPNMDYCRAGYGFGRYYLTFLDENSVRRTVFVDLEDKGNFGEIFAMHGLGDWNGKVLGTKNGYFSHLDANGDLPVGEKYSFRCESTDFSVSGEKFLRGLQLCGQGNCVLTVKGRNGEKKLSYSLAGKQKRAVGLKGDLFSLEIELSKGCVIEQLAVDLEKIGGVR